MWKPLKLHDIGTEEPPMLIESVLTCPHCSHKSAEIMPTDACQSSKTAKIAASG